jgi:hypothetical protein
MMRVIWPVVWMRVSGQCDWMGVDKVVRFVPVGACLADACW